jgi:hypothetical protein
MGVGEIGIWEGTPVAVIMVFRGRSVAVEAGTQAKSRNDPIRMAVTSLRENLDFVFVSIIILLFEV